MFPKFFYYFTFVTPHENKLTNSAWTSASTPLSASCNWLNNACAGVYGYLQVKSTTNTNFHNVWLKFQVPALPSGSVVTSAVVNMRLCGSSVCTPNSVS